MGLDEVVRGAVAMTNKITKDLHGDIILHRWVSQDSEGTPTYAAPVPYKAIIDYRQEARQSATGQLRVARAFIAILEPIPPLGASGRSEPLDERDLVTTPNMSTGPIIETRGLVDGQTNYPYFHEIWLGDRRGTF